MSKNSIPLNTLQRIQAQVSKLRLAELKRNCIIRGMPFEDLTNASVMNLQSWLIKNYNDKINNDLLNEFDMWLEAKLKERGVDQAFLNPIFRLGNILETNDDGEVTKTKRVKGVIKVRVKRERTNEGIFAGTKKAFTVHLQSQGLTKDEVIAHVMEKFPEAKVKSIGIWYNKAKKGVYKKR